MRHWSIRLLRDVIAVLVAGISLLAAFVAIRLSTGDPIHLRFLTPYIEAALTDPAQGFRIDIGETVLSWGGWKHNLDIRAKALTAYDDTNKAFAEIPEISVTLSLKGLLRGLVAPTEITIYNPVIEVVHTAQGDFEIVKRGSLANGVPPEETGENAMPGVEASPLLPTLITDLLASPNPASPAGYLRQAHIVGAKVILTDVKTNTRWDVPSADFVFSRSEKGLSGKVTFGIVERVDSFTFNAEYRYDRNQQEVIVSGSFLNLPLAKVGGWDPALAPLLDFELVASGRSEMVLTPTLRLKQGLFSLVTREGRVHLPGVSKKDEPLEVQSLAITAHVPKEGTSLFLDRFRIQLDGPVLEVKAEVGGFKTVDRPNATLHIKSEAVAQNLPVSLLHLYWPEEAVKNVRKWVIDNVTEGFVTEARFASEIYFPVNDPDNISVISYAGSFDARDATVHYMKPLPPIKGGAVKATVDDKIFRAQILAGHVGKLTIAEGEVTISGLDTQRQDVLVTGHIDGPFQDALELLDHDRLGYPRRLGIRPETASGKANVDLSFAFPAIRDITFDNLDIRAKAQLDQVRIEDVYQLINRSTLAPIELNVTKGRAILDLTGEGMRIEGQAEIAAIPASFLWQEYFVGDTARSIQAKITMNNEDFRRFGYDISKYVDGHVEGRIGYAENSSGQANLNIAADLEKTEMRFPPLGYHKPPGQAAALSGHFKLHKGAITRIEDFRLAGPRLAVHGGANLGALQTVRFDQFLVGETTLKSMDVIVAESETRLNIGGGTIDLSPLLATRKTDAEANGLPDQEDKTIPPFLAETRAPVTLRLGPGREARNVRLNIRHDGKQWDRLIVDANLKGGAEFSLRWQNSGKGTHELRAETKDTGALVELIGITKSVKGGKLELTGSAAHSDPNGSIRGQVRIRDFRVIDAPALARLLTIATLTGFIDLLSGEGFYFDRFKTDFVKTGGRVDLAKASMRGPSLGFTSEGYFDLDKNRIDVAGTIAPINVINQILSPIPLIGEIFTGVDGEGLFAVSYRAEGKLDEPGFRVNPLTALAPGIFRDIFD